MQEGPLPWAVLGAEGALVLVSRSFEKATGLGAGSPCPAWLGPAPAEGQTIQIDERHFDVWTRPFGEGRLVGLCDRTEIAQMEDQLWEHQTRLSKAYSEVSVRNQVLTSTLEKLREREAELSALNRGLEEKVGEQLRQIERSQKLRRYLSPEVANSIVSSEAPDLATRKRVVSVLFVDLSSFDEIVGEMESEEIIELLNDYHREMIGILFANGGTLDKFISARIMAFFGDPVPHEDHAARAVRTAIEMRERVRERRATWFGSSDAADLQVGINTGWATVGNVGSEHRMDYTVIGKNVALASSLQQEAKPGQVLLSARTYEAVKNLFDLEGLKVVLKGSSRPITVYNARVEKVALGAPTTALRPIEIVEREAPMPTEQRRMGPYLMLEKLGEGGMGVVYKALDERLQRTVALKILASELATDAKFVARFKREARALASLNSPHIAQIYFVSDQEVPPFFAMEFIEGPTLQRVLADQGKLPLRRALDLVTQMAQGLQAAAERGVIHRDVKPDNVILTLKGHVKLTDFGLAKAANGDAGLTTRGIILGTPLYMSPEQARGAELDLRSDIYSLGATLFHMLAGEPPFRGEGAVAVMRKHEEAPLPALSALPPAVSPCVYQILQRMMAKKPEERFESYEKLLEALETC